MRLVIPSKGVDNVRYTGRGIFSSIGRRLFSFGLKKVINNLENENRNQLIANTVVNGSQDPSTNSPLNKEKIIQHKRVKRKLDPERVKPNSSLSKVKRYSTDKTNKIINKSGSGIVFD